ncbi:MAG: hypothetical protein JWR51_4543 [Devosia sp.]|nr:hypothetical protein [Devosia sp.]
MGWGPRGPQGPGFVIQYSLHCANAHDFDAWFKNAAAFDEQQARGIVQCPVCASNAVNKALMAPAVARSGSEKMSLSSGHPDVAKFRELLRAYRQKVTSEADYVGDKFAEEARKIHFEEVEARGIYGEATRDEVIALAEEGIEFAPLPDLPEESN